LKEAGENMLKHSKDLVEEELALGVEEGHVLLTRCCPDQVFALQQTLPSRGNSTRSPKLHQAVETQPNSSKPGAIKTPPAP